MVNYSRTAEELLRGYNEASASNPLVLSTSEVETLTTALKSKRGISRPTGDILSTSFKEFVSPIDGTVISSRNKLKDHEKRHNVVQVGNDLESKGNHGKTREQSKQHQGNL
jgi:hypothetical protein